MRGASATAAELLELAQLHYTTQQSVLLCCAAMYTPRYTPRFVPVLVSVVFTYTMVQVIQKWLEVAYCDRLMFIQLIRVVIFLFFANSLEC